MGTETLYIRDERGEFIPATGDDLVAAAKHHLSRRVRRGTALTSPRLVRDYLKVRMGARDCEYFCLLLLDTWHRILDFVELFRGTIDGARQEIQLLTVALREARVLMTFRGRPSDVLSESRMR